MPAGAKSGLLDFVSRTAAETYASSRRLREVGKNYQPKVPYPATGLGNRLDLAARGHRDRVLMMTFSEFGRRARENGSKGTDHGSAAPMFLVGGKVKPGVVGDHPSLTKLSEGNLVHATDFRRVY